MSRLVLITNNYPFSHNGGEVMFVRSEVPWLAQSFSSVVIAPCYPTGSEERLPDGVTLDVGFKGVFPTKNAKRLYFVTKAIFSSYRSVVLSEIRFAYSLWGLRGVKKALIWTAGVAAAMDVLESFVGKYSDSVFYTYWNTEVTVGLALLKVSKKICKPIVTRCHGYDLYEERGVPPYIPFRSFVSGQLDLIVPISNAGAEYVVGKGGDKNKVFVHRLGTVDPGVVSSSSIDGVLRIVSCSSFVSVKRVDLIARSVLRLSEKHPNFSVVWTHIGDGALRGDVEDVLSESKGNFRARLVGALSNDEVLDFYRKHPVDVFVNLSESEGIPVSIMEALSFGIPVVATNVGGVCEIVSSDNGFLLSGSPTTDEVVSAIEGVVFSDKAVIESRRFGARKSWEKRYQSAVVHKNFAKFLSSL